MNITEITEEFIKDHPYVKQGIKNNIINYSKLARKIGKEKGISQKDAILIACRRYFQKISKSKDYLPIMDVLNETKLHIRNKIAVVILEPETKFDRIIELQKLVDEKKEIMHVVRGNAAITLITPDNFLSVIKRKFPLNILKENKDLVEIVLKSSIKLEEVPGVMGYIYSLFGENNINIVETISCWTDTIFVIARKDLVKTMELLSFSNSGNTA
jgi:hypothetical protein